MPDEIQAAPAQSTPTDATPASTASPSDALATLTETERQEWRLTGALPKAAAAGDPKPAATSTPAPSAAAPTEAERQISKRQQDINDRIRDAVERATADTKAEVARLRAQLTPAAPRSDDPTPKAPAPAADKFPKYDEYLATNPDASLEDWMDARDTWRDDRRTQAEHQRSAAAQRADAQQARQTTFSEQIGTRAKADPEFLTKISPEVLALRPFASLAEGEQGGPLNAIAEELLDSPIAPVLMEHFTTHPDELARLAALRDPRSLVREFGKLEARLTPAAAAADDAPPKTVTSAPTPGTFLGTRAATAADPVASAVRTRDAGAYIREANARELSRARK